MDKQEECLRAKDSVIKTSRGFVDRWWWIEKRENEGVVAQEEGGGVGIEGTISRLEANMVPSASVSGVYLGSSLLPFRVSHHSASLSEGMLPPRAPYGARRRGVGGHGRFCSLWYFISELGFG